MATGAGIRGIKPVLYPVVPDQLDSRPRHKHDGGENRVGDGKPVAIPRHADADPAVDDAEGQQRATPIDVHVADGPAGPLPLVVPVVHDAKDGLEGERDDDQYAEDGVSVVEELLGFTRQSRETWMGFFVVGGAYLAGAMSDRDTDGQRSKN